MITYLKLLRWNDLEKQWCSYNNLRNSEELINKLDSPNTNWTLSFYFWVWRLCHYAGLNEVWLHCGIWGHVLTFWLKILIMFVSCLFFPILTVGMQKVAPYCFFCLVFTLPNRWFCSYSHRKFFVLWDAALDRVCCIQKSGLLLVCQSWSIIKTTC